MYRLEVQGHALNSFPEFEKLFINKYAPLDENNIVRDKLRELWQRGSMQEYITAFSSVVVVLPELGREDTIYTYVYGLKPHLKGFVKA